MVGGLCNKTGTGRLKTSLVSPSTGRSGNSFSVWWIEFRQAWAGGGLGLEMGCPLPWHERFLRRSKQVESPSPPPDPLDLLVSAPREGVLLLVQRGLDGLGSCKDLYSFNSYFSVGRALEPPHAACSPTALWLFVLCFTVTLTPMSPGQPRINLRHPSLLGHKDPVPDKHLVAGTECSKALGLKQA